MLDAGYWMLDIGAFNFFDSWSSSLRLRAERSRKQLDLDFINE